MQEYIDICDVAVGLCGKHAVSIHVRMKLVGFYLLGVLYYPNIKMGISFGKCALLYAAGVFNRSKVTFFVNFMRYEIVNYKDFCDTAGWLIEVARF